LPRCTAEVQWSPPIDKGSRFAAGQLVVAKRKIKRAPHLSPGERLLFAITAMSVPLRRLEKLAITVSPATILKFHRQMNTRKYSRLFGEKQILSRAGRSPFPLDIRTLVIEINSRNPSCGCPQIASIVKDRTAT